jgi:hypothetical protein
MNAAMVAETGSGRHSKSGQWRLSRRSQGSETALTVTTDPRQRHLAQRFLLSLSDELALDVEAATALKLVERERHAGKCSFWFVDASTIRECTEMAMPPFQELMVRGQLQQITLSRADAYRGACGDELCAVSRMLSRITTLPCSGITLFV